MIRDLADAAASLFQPFAVPLSEILRIFSMILPFDFARYVVGAGGVFLLVWIIGRERLAERKIREETPGVKQMRREILVSLRTTVIFSIVGVATVMAHHGFETGDAHAAGEASWQGVALSTLLLIVAHDAWFYWTHRLMHLPRFFRRMHREHHKSVNPTPWTAYSFNVSEAATHAVFLLLALFFIPAPQFAIFLFLTHMILRNAIGHCGFELFPARRNGRPVFDWLTTVTHHDLHHANARYNFGLYFTWWDRLMGTEHPDYHARFAQSVGRPLEGSAVGALKMHRSRFLAIAGLFIAANAISAATNRAVAEAETQQIEALGDIAGRWVTEGHGAYVDLMACDDGALCGDIVWRWDNGPTDSSGDERFLSGFKWREGAWRDGRVISPEDGRTYRGVITVTQDGVLKLKGCALVFCQTRHWRRIEDIPALSGAEAQTVAHQ